MKRRRGKRIAWWITGVGLLVVLACTVAFKDRAAEQYWLWKLESEDIEDQKAAAERLAEMGSVRAVPVLLAVLGGRCQGRDDFQTAVRGMTPYIMWPHWPKEDRTVPITGPAQTPKGPLSDSIDVWVDDRSEELMWALTEITTRAPRASVPCLVKALDEKDDYIRHVAAGLVGTTGHHGCGAVPQLIGVLKSRTFDLRFQAAIALARIGPAANRAVPALTTALQDKDRFVREAAAEALGQIGPDAVEAVPALTELLQDEEEDIQNAATEALKKIEGHEEPKR